MNDLDINKELEQIISQSNDEEMNWEDFFSENSASDEYDFVLLDDGKIEKIQPQVVRLKPLSAFGGTLSSCNDFEELLNTLGSLRMQGYKILFRGHAKDSFTLASTIVRNHVKEYGQEKVVLEKVKSICKSRGYEKYKMDTFNDNLFYMSIGRHLGLYSRLLDWTASIDDALAFLIEDKDDYLLHDGALWLLIYHQNEYREERNKDPFSIEDSRVHILREDYYIPDETIEFPIGIDRRYKQHGFFTVQAEKYLDVPFEKMARASGFELHKFIVPKETKQLLAMGNKLPLLSWLYGNQNEPIVSEVKRLNDMYDYRQ